MNKERNTETALDEEIAKEDRHRDYCENDAIEIPVSKRMRFKFSKPAKAEFA